MINLRPMRDILEDYRHMRDWFAEPGLKEWVWCDEKGEADVPLARIIEKYGERIRHPADVFPYFILLDGDPVGFIQYYIHSRAEIGLDMWIGVPMARNRGYGTEALRQMVEIIHHKHPEIRTLFIDPEKKNLRAVRCYQKAGFQTESEYIDEEGAECLLMKIHFESADTSTDRSCGAMLDV